MTNRQLIVTYWLEKASQDLASARDNMTARRIQNAVSDAYFACFHAFSAVLFHEEQSFKKHREVRAFLHRDYIKPGKIAVHWGQHYDWLFESRHEADYKPLAIFDPDEVQKVIEASSEFVNQMKEFIQEKQEAPLQQQNE